MHGDEQIFERGLVLLHDRLKGGTQLGHFFIVTECAVCFSQIIELRLDDGVRVVAGQRHQLQDLVTHYFTLLFGLASAAMASPNVLTAVCITRPTASSNTLPFGVPFMSRSATGGGGAGASSARSLRM